MIVYPLYGDMRSYRVSHDRDFDASKPIKEAFLRTYSDPKSSGNASIVCGHDTTIHQDGKHYTWFRHPLKRDISHFNYDSKFGNEMDPDLATHLALMNGNFLVRWLYSRYCSLSNTSDIEEKYDVVREALREKNVKIYDSDDFENSWTEIADELKVEVEPRLNSNEGGKSYEQLVNYSDMTEEFKIWHRSYNHHDYLLYEEFCT